MTKKSGAPRLSIDQLREIYRRRGLTDLQINSLGLGPEHIENRGAVDAAPPSSSAKKTKSAETMIAKVKSPYRSKSESRFADFLTSQQLAGRVREWRHEAVTLSLSLPGERCRYTPDFLVVLKSGKFFLVEVKGAYCREDARVKYLTAKMAYPMMNIKLVVVNRDSIFGTEFITDDEPDLN